MNGQRGALDQGFVEVEYQSLSICGRGYLEEALTFALSLVEGRWVLPLDVIEYVLR